MIRKLGILFVLSSCAVLITACHHYYPVTAAPAKDAQCQSIVQNRAFVEQRSAGKEGANLEHKQVQLTQEYNKLDCKN